MRGGGIQAPRRQQAQVCVYPPPLPHTAQAQAQAHCAIPADGDRTLRRTTHRSLPPLPFTPPLLRRRRKERYQSLVWLAGKRHYLGTFMKAEDAARAHDIALLASTPNKKDVDEKLLNYPVPTYAAHLAALKGKNDVRQRLQRLGGCPAGPWLL